MTDDVAKRQRVLAAFRATQVRAVLLFLPILAAFMVGVSAFDHPDNEIMGLSGGTLIYTLFGVGAASFIAFMYFWRCPVCKTQLGFQRGFSQSFCRRCGALFTAGTPGAGVEAAEFKKSQVEAAIKKDLGQYRGWRALRMMRGLVLLVAGILVALFARPEPGQPQPDAKILKAIGSHDTTYLIIGIGILVALIGAALVWQSIWAMTKGAELREKQARSFLDKK